ncbi:MAG: substrate-binding domain-containing protein [Lentisphaeria bacterium]
MSEARKKNHLKAKRYLVKQIRQLAIGDSLPSIRSMVLESGLGRRVLEVALETMLTYGYIESRERSGIYKTAKVSHKYDKLVVDVICCSEAGYLDSPNNFFATLRDELCFEATSNDCLIRMHQIKEDAPLSSYDKLIVENDINFAFLLSPHTIEIEKVFANFHIDTLTLLPRYQTPYSYAIIDSPDMVDIQMNHLFNLGHKQIAFIGEFQPEHASLIHMSRTMNYYRIMAENGYKVYPQWVMHNNYNNEVLAKKLSLMFSEEAPTAVICCDMALTALYHFLVFKKLQIGKDVSIISCDNLEHLRLFPEPTTVVNSRKVIAKMAWKMFEDIISNKEIVKIQYPPLSLKIRASTKELN